MDQFITVLDLVVLAVCVPVIVRKSLRARRAGDSSAS